MNLTNLLIFLIVAATVASDLLQAWDGRRSGGVHSASGLGRHLQRWPIVLSIVCMAVSFFSFIAALRIADMSYVVPASAASIAVETLLASFLLHERVSARRWAGALLVGAGVLLWDNPSLMLSAIIAALTVAAMLYQIVVIVACWRYQSQKRYPDRPPEPISILKPVRGLDPGFYEAIRSHVGQEYGDYEILFGLADPHDPAYATIERLQAEFPSRAIRIIQTKTVTPNRKVGVLIDLCAEARHELLLVNDSDIRIPFNYLRDVAAPLADSNIGLVTCLYRATATTFAGKMEALGISTDFAPSTLVAPLVGVNEFGLGSTLCFRRTDLEAIGGFKAIADYLADDYQLAKRITTGLGKRAWMSHVIVDTALQAENWRDVWLHQVRWHRTIRVSRPGGYLGLPITYASLWAVMALLAGWPTLALSCLAARYAAVFIAGVMTLQCPIASRYWLLAPLRDWFGAAIWIAGLFGNKVRWRDRELTLTADGRIKT